MKKKNVFIATVLATLFSCALTGCEKSPAPEQAQEVTRIQGKGMGTFYAITVPGGYPGGEVALKTVAEKTIKDISDAISSFDKNSEIYKFNAWKSKDPFPISDRLAYYVEEATHQGLRIDFAMDISIGPLVNLWGFGKDKKLERIPTEEQIANAKEYIGRDKYEVRHTPNGALLIKKDPRMEIDLSTVGEGLGVDEIAAILDRNGIRNYLVSIAGASRSKGLNPNGRFWKIGIEDPTDPDHRIFTTVCPLDQAMSTSGSYRNFFKDDASGKIFSHAIDPKTGHPVSHETLSVTVIDRSAFVTDAIDTGLLVMGADKALEWADRNQVAIYTIESKDGKPVGRASKAFEKYLKCSQDNTAAAQ
ncbi:MAG: FAD:protein FMN transferase [Succinivibrio sp.]|nr:FAD:protein FMN transferase [Succinivibrio sp.]